MDNSKFLKIVIIILLIINICTLGFIWTHHHMGPPPPHDHGGNAGDFLQHELKLNDQQQKQFDQLRDEHHEEAEQLQKEGRELHRKFFDLLHSTADSATVLQLAASIADNQKQMEMMTFNHFKKVRALCTPDQQKRFDEVIDEAMRMMAPKPPGREGPPREPEH